MDNRIIRDEPLCDPVMIGYQGPAIFLLWHEYLLLPSCARQGCDLVMLVSRSGDADWLVGFASHFGHGAVRGSSRKGGSEAILTIVKQLKGKSLVITPDGPQGPRREVASGCIYMASLLGTPIVPLGCGYDRPWRFKKSWDQFAVPRPGSRARIRLGRAIHVPKKLGRDGVEDYRQIVQASMTQMTAEAEQWATTGETRLDETPFYIAKRESLIP
jgi:lysophospholipid acyltransferase (LPLAT)-like uncharacterized protein